jgi:hypothetical protein
MQKYIICIVLNMASTQISYAMDNTQKESTQTKQLDQSWKKTNINGITVIESEKEVTTIRAYELISKTDTINKMK